MNDFLRRQFSHHHVLPTVPPTWAIEALTHAGVSLDPSTMTIAFDITEKPSITGNTMDNSSCAVSSSGDDGSSTTKDTTL